MDREEEGEELFFKGGFMTNTISDAYESTHTNTHKAYMETEYKPDNIQSLSTPQNENF